MGVVGLHERPAVEGKRHKLERVDTLHRSEAGRMEIPSWEAQARMEIPSWAEAHRGLALGMKASVVVEVRCVGAKRRM